MIGPHELTKPDEGHQTRSTLSRTIAKTRSTLSRAIDRVIQPAALSAFSFDEVPKLLGELLLFHAVQVHVTQVMTPTLGQLRRTDRMAVAGVDAGQSHVNRGWAGRGLAQGKSCPSRQLGGGCVRRISAHSRSSTSTMPSA